MPNPHPSLFRLHAALSGLLHVETRQAELTPAEARLEAEWTDALEPVMADLYWHPFRNGLSAAPDDEGELRSWLRRQLGTAAATAALLALLSRFLVRGANVGGQMALGLMGVGGTFRLTNPDMLAELEAHADDLTTLGRPMSLIDTTVDDLVRGVPQARQDEDNTLAVLAALIGGWALLRSGRIAATEQTRSAGRGLGWAFGRNGVTTLRFVTREDASVCPQCAGQHGRRFPVNNIPADASIPLHPVCRCTYKPVLTGWTPPANIWRGGP